MTVLESPIERRLSGIEHDLTIIKTRLEPVDLVAMQTDLAVIKSRLDNLPTRWMFWVLLLTTTIPIYGILAMLLVQVLRAS